MVETLVCLAVATFLFALWWPQSRPSSSDSGPGMQDASRSSPHRASVDR